MTIISDLLDRVHVLNQLISYDKLTCYRYFPGLTGKIPFIVPFIGASTYTRTDPSDLALESLRTVTLLCVVSSPQTDIPLQTAYSHAENIIDPLLAVYRDRAWLDVNGEAFLHIRDACRIVEDSGIVFNDLERIFEIRFTLTVPLIRPS